MAGQHPLVVLTSLAAEGTPRLALELCRILRRDGMSSGIERFGAAVGRDLAHWVAP